MNIEKKLGAILSEPSVVFRKIKLWFLNIRARCGFVRDKHQLVNNPFSTIYLNLNESPMMRSRAFGLYEYEKARLLRSFLEPGMTVVDIGANKGFFSLLAASLLSDRGEVHSIEPHPFNCKWLKKSVESNRYQCISVHQMAFWNENKEINLNLGERSGSHSIVRNSDLGSVKVQAKRLDDFVEGEKIESIDLVKIDVEGAEINVIEGAQAVLRDYKPLIVLDIHDVDRGKLYDLLDENNYNIYSYGLGFDGQIKKKCLDKTQFISEKEITDVTAISSERSKLLEKI